MPILWLTLYSINRYYLFFNKTIFSTINWSGEILYKRTKLYYIFSWSLESSINAIHSLSQWASYGINQMFIECTLYVLSECANCFLPFLMNLLISNHIIMNSLIIMMMLFHLLLFPNHLLLLLFPVSIWF